ncbi:MAG TPA: hypothetical protein DCK98_00740 [Chloroflexi bacterium]|nr:hypothetical protein [Chloroflexota bacterium]HAL27057.1 hypothetical protein [Chloroflexota bacterium]
MTAVTPPVATAERFTAPWMPSVVPGAIVALAGARAAGWRWLAAAGLAFGLVTAALSVAIAKGDVGLPLFGALSAMPAFALGAWLANEVWTVVATPERGRVVLFVVVAGRCAPAVTGALDLYLRARTP